MIKKILAVLFAALTVASCFVGCSKTESKTENNNYYLTDEEKTKNFVFDLYLKDKKIDFPITVGDFCELIGGKLVLNPYDDTDENYKTGYVYNADEENTYEFLDEYDYETFGNYIEINFTKPFDKNGNVIENSIDEDWIICDIHGSYKLDDFDFECMNNRWYENGMWQYNYRGLDLKDHHKNIFSSTLGIGVDKKVYHIGDKVTLNELKDIFPNLKVEEVLGYQKTKYNIYLSGEKFGGANLEITYLPIDHNNDEKYDYEDKTQLEDNGLSHSFAYDYDAINNGAGEGIITGMFQIEF